MHLAVGQGVPRHHRGEIWKFLVEQCHLKHLFLSKQQPKDMPYKELLKQLTSQQHTILIDLGDNQRMHKLEKTNSSLHKQNCDLLEQLQAANGRIQSLGATPEKLLTSESKLKQAALALELEWSALLQTVEQLWRQMAELGGREPDPTLPEPLGD
ncbi:hypothetical protein R6Z07F_009692 [Ovis aries]